MKDDKGILGITMGDPAGIGPEITARVCASHDMPAPAVVLGDPVILARTISDLRLDLKIREVGTPDEALFDDAGIVNLIALSDLPVNLPYGEVQAACGQAAYSYVKHGIDLALSGDIAGIVTAPIHKEALSAAGVPYPGHTEILADLAGTEDYAMMLVNDELRVILVTIHVPLRQAVDDITVESELATIRLAALGCRLFGISSPRIAVAGLNPHAGEGGLFGNEDDDIIAPAIARAIEEGINATGPWPGDTVFMRARRGEFDIVVAQYHDQGLIPVKYLGVDHGVNVTVGLPFVRTSVDHGTAFDIAGQGVAEASSMRVAFEMATQMVGSRTGET